MPKLVPPPEERFNPVTAQWLTPGGAPPDPDRDALDPAHADAVRLVDPVPPELDGWTPAAATRPAADVGLTAARRVLWAVTALVALGVAGVTLVQRSGSCADPGECTVSHAGGPVGWVFVAGLLWLAIIASRRAITGRR